MKRLLNIYLLAVLFCAFSTQVSAQSSAGKIIDIFGKGMITIQVDGGHPFAEGDTVELVYMAGVLPMMVGDYEVTTAAGDVFLAKPLSQNIPPDKGMNVEVSLIKNSSGSTENKKANKAVEASQETQPPIVSAQISSVDTDLEIEGEVAAVSGADVTISFTGTAMPKAGWLVDLFYVVPSSGKELPVGTWQVQTIAGQTVTATKLKGVGNARKGLKAVIHKKQGKKPVAPKPQITEPVYDLSVETKTDSYKSNQANQPQQITLLGQSAPTVNVYKTKAHAFHILVKTEAEAARIIAGMKGLSGNNLKEKFIHEAKTNSTCPTGKKGGDLGFFPRGRMVAEFDAVVFDMKPGTITTKPIKTVFGYHVIYLQESL